MILWMFTFLMKWYWNFLLRAFSSCLVLAQSSAEDVCWTDELKIVNVFRSYCLLFRHASVSSTYPLAWDKMCKVSKMFKYRLDCWILVRLASSVPEHFLESMLVHSKQGATFFWPPLVKYKVKWTRFQNWFKTHPKVENAQHKCLLHHFGGVFAWKSGLHF